MAERLTESDLTQERCRELVSQYGDITRASEALAGSVESERFPGKRLSAKTISLHISARLRGQSLSVRPRRGPNDDTDDARQRAQEAAEAAPIIRDRKKVFNNWRDIAREADKESRRRESTDPSVNRGVVDFSKSKQPIGIFTISDLHLGSPQCDYLTFLKHCELLADTPNLYAIIQGDVLEWSISPRMMDATLNQVLPPNVQARTFRAIIDEIADKIVAAIIGNHEGRVERFTGFDIGEYLYDALQKARGGFYMRDGGLLEIKVGSQEYSWLVMHGDMMRGNSMYSNTANVSRLARHGTGFFDVMSSGHIHEPEVKVVWEPRVAGADKEMTVLIRSGSYKVLGREQWVDRQGLIGPKEVVSPCVIFFPDTRAMLPFARIEDAVRVLNALNRKAAA